MDDASFEYRFEQFWEVDGVRRFIDGLAVKGWRVHTLTFSTEGAHEVWCALMERAIRGAEI
jgi:hypothetical protein